MIVLCISPVSYNAKSDGHLVRGYRVRTGYQSDSFAGVMPHKEAFFISEKAFAETPFSFGDSIDVDFDMSGRVKKLTVEKRGA